MYILYLGIMTVLSLQSFVRDADASHRIKKKKVSPGPKTQKKNKKTFVFGERIQHLGYICGKFFLLFLLLFPFNGSFVNFFF